MDLEPLLNVCVVLWLFGLAIATALGRGRQFLSGSEGAILKIVLWPVRTLGRLLKHAWRQVGKLVWRAVVRAAQTLWERIWRW
jgi:hypothetical protein